MAQAQGQSFSQLKDAKDEQTEVVFNPMEQVNPRYYANCSAEVKDSKVKDCRC